jgi:hypothetical protein
MEFNTFQNVVKAGTPFDKGQMMDSWLFYDTPYRFVAQADIARTPYFVYNEEGTIYTTKNKGFISKGIVGQINQITYSENLGLPYSYEETNKTLANRRNKLLEQMGVLEVIR